MVAIICLFFPSKWCTDGAVWLLLCNDFTLVGTRFTTRFTSLPIIMQNLHGDAVAFLLFSSAQDGFVAFGKTLICNYALHSVTQKVPKARRCHGNGSSVGLVDDGPFHVLSRQLVQRFSIQDPSFYASLLLASISTRTASGRRVAPPCRIVFDS